MSCTRRITITSFHICFHYNRYRQNRDSSTATSLSDFTISQIQETTPRTTTEEYGSKAPKVDTVDAADVTICHIWNPHQNKAKQYCTDGGSGTQGLRDEGRCDMINIFWKFSAIQNPSDSMSAFSLQTPKILGRPQSIGGYQRTIS
jgi:hypothetical protein